MPTPNKPKQKKLTISKPRSVKANPSAQKLQEMIAEAAYYKAEQRNFSPGFEELDWFEAEKEVNKRLRTK